MSVALTFDALEAHRVGLRGHCYRMLGALGDAEDAVQETLIKAWQALSGLTDPGALKGWLYRIATRVCLDAIEARTRRALPWNLGPPGTTESPLDAREPGTWVEPAPDASILPADVSPVERAILAQSVRLAFLAALQLLPGRQRAALLLTEVLGLSAAEAAECLECSVPSLTSALQRARATLAAQDLSAVERPASSPAEDALVARYVDAFERYDMEALTAILRADAWMQMPPLSLWLRGTEDITAWMLGRGGACRGSRLVPVAASVAPTFGQYKPDPDGPGYVPWSLIVLEVDAAGGRIAGVHHFLDTGMLFPRFGLPGRLDATGVGQR